MTEAPDPTPNDDAALAGGAEPVKAPADDPIMDRRLGEERRGAAQRKASAAKSAKGGKATERRQGDRRKTPSRPRSINQYDMSPEVLEFVNAVNAFRERTGNRFPSAADILKILEDLGYEKRTP